MCFNKSRVTCSVPEGIYNEIFSTNVFFISSPERNKYIKWLIYFQTLTFLVPPYDSAGS